MDNELWKPIPGYEGLYEVSDYGRVKSLRSNRIMTAAPNRKENGYYRVTLSKNGISTKQYVHRLVVKAFLEDPIDDTYEVNHKNKITSDNRLCNLEWVTHKDNIKHRFNWHPEYQILNLLTNEWEDFV